ncbi:inosose dehydratase [Marmoricola sp. URHA0025 HA25]
MKIGAAPVSWGICEVPGWGYQIPAARVLDEMAQVGLRATELGPPGFLPDDGNKLATELNARGLQAIGAFAPIVLHDPTSDVVADALPYLERLRACSADTLVVAAASGVDGYDSRPHLDDEQWDLLLSNLELLSVAAAELGITAVLHPHMGTVVEQEFEVLRVLDGSSIPLCLDTGHLLIGGTDPLELCSARGDRIAHVQLKDVDALLAAQVKAGDLTYTQGVGRGMYRPLGQGDIDIRGVVTELAARRYTGWLVLEQDRILPTEQAGIDSLEEVKASVAFMQSVLAEAGSGRGQS